MYLFRVRDSNMYKIGYTSNIKKRIKQQQVGNPGEIELVHSFASRYPSLLEKAMHGKFKSKKVRGEWFELTDDEVNSFVEHCSKTESNFAALESQDNVYFLKYVTKISRFY